MNLLQIIGDEQKLDSFFNCLKSKGYNKKIKQKCTHYPIENFKIDSLSNGILLTHKLTLIFPKCEKYQFINKYGEAEEYKVPPLDIIYSRLNRLYKKFSEIKNCIEFDAHTKWNEYRITFSFFRNPFTGKHLSNKSFLMRILYRIFKAYEVQSITITNEEDFRRENDIECPPLRTLLYFTFKEQAISNEKNKQAIFNLCNTLEEINSNIPQEGKVGIKMSLSADHIYK